MTTYTGSCHCQRIRFEIDTVLDRVTACNCSICSKKGILHHRVKPEDFRLLSGEADLGTYRFGTMVAKHHFCTTCGIHVFTRPRAAPELCTVNVRCLEGVDLSRLTLTPFDGRNFDVVVDLVREGVGRP